MSHRWNPRRRSNEFGPPVGDGVLRHEQRLPDPGPLRHVARPTGQTMHVLTNISEPLPSASSGSRGVLNGVSGPDEEPALTNSRGERGAAGARTSQRRIKVMLAIDGLGLGGAEMVVRDLARFLDRDWFDVCVCCTKGLGGAIGEEMLRDGIDVFVLPGQQDGRVDYLTALKFRRAVKDRAIDIVHSHAMPALLDVSPCRLTMPGLKTVHTFHFGNYPHDSWRYHVMEGLCARAVDRLIAVGLEQRRRIQAAYRLPDSRIGMIWNGVTPASPMSDGLFRTKVGTADRLLIGTVAKLIEQKGLDDLLRVALACSDAGHRMQFVIVGEGPLRPVLEQRRRELGLEDTGRNHRVDPQRRRPSPSSVRRVLPAIPVGGDVHRDSRGNGGRKGHRRDTGRRQPTRPRGWRERAPREPG